MAETLALHTVGATPPMAGLKRLVEDFERRLILSALARAQGNQRRAAAELGCLPTTLNEKLRRLGLRACDRSMGDGLETESGGPDLVGNA
jgi:DNA-binding NtrC family response regulator